ncbi:MAG: DUF6715 family protein [Acetatifactor sp.]
MKKSTIGVTIILIVFIIGLVGVYALMTSKARIEAADAVMTPVQIALNRDLSKDYPATVKEVIKYYADLEKCFYNEECTDEEIEQLGMKARGLYDEDLLAINEVGTYMIKLKADIADFHESNCRITAIAVAASTNVDFFSADGFDFARIHCAYTVSENGKSKMEGRVYLLRRDKQRHWKIYGWDSADNVNPE